MSIYEKISEALGEGYAGQGESQYLKDAALGLSQLPEDEWNGLGEDIKGWYNEFASAYDANGQDEEWVPPTMEGLAEAIEAYVPPEKPAKAAKKEKVAKEPKEPKPKKEKVAKEPKESVPSNSGIMRDLLAEAYDVSLDELMTKLEEKGVVAKRSSVHIVWFNTQKTMEVLLKAGGFKDKAGNSYKITKE